MTEPRVVEMREMIQCEVDMAEDTVRVYRLCERCVPATEVIGLGLYVDRSDDDEIV